MFFSVFFFKTIKNGVVFFFSESSSLKWQYSSGLVWSRDF
jgi:hypothetical protein